MHSSLLVFFCWLIHGLDKTLGPLSCVFYFILEWTVVVLPKELKWRKEENEKIFGRHHPRGLIDRTCRPDRPNVRYPIDRILYPIDRSSGKSPDLRTEVFPFETLFPNLSPTCALSLMQKFGAINRVFLSTLKVDVYIEDETYQLILSLIWGESLERFFDSLELLRGCAKEKSYKVIAASTLL